LLQSSRIFEFFSAGISFGFLPAAMVETHFDQLLYNILPKSKSE